jgi:hypothetical protein
MLGWFGRKPKIKNGAIPLEDEAFAGNGRPALAAEMNVARLRAPLDRGLYSQALKAKGHISLRAVHDEYERTVRQKAPPDNARDEEDASIIDNVAKNEQSPVDPAVTVIFSPWIIVRGELIRVFAFKNLSGPGTETKIEIRLRLVIEGYEARTLVHLLVKPQFAERNKNLASVFAPSDDLDGYKVLVARVEPADTGVNFVVFDMGDGEHLVNVLKLGREITIKLAEYKFNQLRYALPHLALPNDSTFPDRYDFFKASTILGAQFASTPPSTGEAVPSTGSEHENREAC